MYVPAEMIESILSHSCSFDSCCIIVITLPRKVRWFGNVRLLFKVTVMTLLQASVYFWKRSAFSELAESNMSGKSEC